MDMMERKIQLLLVKHSQVFLLCCALRNFTLVARSLHTSQSAISKSILELENEIGVLLFDRTCRPMRVTPEARQLERHIIHLLNDTKHLLSDIQNNNFIKPTIRVGITPSLSTTLGPELIKKLLPTVSNLDVHVISSEFLYEQLLKRKLDTIITNDAFEPDEQFTRKELFEEPSVLVLPKSFERPYSQPWTLSELSSCGLPLIRFGDNNSAGYVNEVFLRTQGLNLPKRLIVHNNSLLFTLIAQGLGWVYARPTTILQNKYLKDQLFIAPFPEPQLIRKVSFFYRTSEFTPQISALVEFTRDCLRDYIFPEILEMMPWVEPQLKLSQENDDKQLEKE